MSAKRTQTVLLVALTQLVWLGTAPGVRAAAPAGSPAGLTPPVRVIAPKPITREDAELMLREARGAIEQGRLDEAEKILSRVEGAHVNFSVFHVGPTPASVRRELTRAQRTTQTSGKTSSPAGGKNYLPFCAAAAGRPRLRKTPLPHGRWPAKNRPARRRLQLADQRLPRLPAAGWATSQRPEPLLSQQQRRRPQICPARRAVIR